MLTEETRGPRELAEIKLPVAVGEKHVLHGCAIEPRPDGGPISSIAGMADNPQLGNAVSQAAQDMGSVIGAAVVHDDDFQLGSQSSAHLGRLANHPGDIALLVETGNDHGKTHRWEPNATPEPLASEIVRGYVRRCTGKTWVFAQLE